MYIYAQLFIVAVILTLPFALSSSSDEDVSGDELVKNTSDEDTSNCVSQHDASLFSRSERNNLCDTKSTENDASSTSEQNDSCDSMLIQNRSYEISNQISEHEVSSDSTPKQCNSVCDSISTEDICDKFTGGISEHDASSVSISEEKSSHGAISAEESDTDYNKAESKVQHRRRKRRRVTNYDSLPKYSSSDGDIEDLDEEENSDRTESADNPLSAVNNTINTISTLQNSTGDVSFFENERQRLSDVEDNIENMSSGSSSTSEISTTASPPQTSDEEVNCPDNENTLPVCIGSSKSKASFVGAFLAMSKKHKFSKSARHDILKLINQIVPEPNIPPSNHSFEKSIWDTLALQYVKHELCPDCNFLLDLETKECQNENCRYFENIPTREATEMFFVIPVETQLKRVLAENWQLIVKHKDAHKHNDRKLRDICCGRVYQNLEGHENPRSLISFVYHIDGAPTVKSKTLNLWPMQCFVVELPISVRYSFKNIIFSGLWFGTKKPLLQMFQEKFVEQVEQLNVTGMQFQMREGGEIVTLTCLKVLGHLADLVAKAPSVNMKQFNGEFGCSVCLHPGEMINKGRGHVRVYPVYNDQPERRTHQDTLLHAMAAQQSGTAFFGVVGTSPLHRVLQIPDSLMLDYMHLVLEGEFSRRFSIWLNPRNEHGYLAKRTAALEKKMLDISFPHDFNRKLRPISEFKRWKDREIQNFFLYASLPLLKFHLPSEYYHHLSLLVTAVWLLITDEVKMDDVDLARMLLTHYGRMVETLYGTSEVTYTVHALQHLPEQVINFGPLILHSGFVFEAMISHLKRLFHGTRCIPDQIVKNLLIAQASSSYVEDNISDDEMKTFARNMIHQKSGCSEQEFADGIRLFRPFQRDPRLDNNVKEALRKELGPAMETRAIQQSFRMRKDHQVYHSMMYRRRGKSCSFIVQFQSSGRRASYGKVHSYLIVNGSVPLAVIKTYQRDGKNVCFGLPEPYDELLKAYYDQNLLGNAFVSVKESEEIVVTKCTSIQRRCIFIPSSEDELNGYVSAVLKHYEHD